jgi:maleylpyruvate isomerase
MATVRGLTDDQVGAPSRLPGWTVGHLITHLARNADSHTRRLEGALRGQDVPRYPGGVDQRSADIEAGAGRPAAELVADLDSSQSRLEEVWDRSAAAGWPHDRLTGGSRPTTTAGPALHRLEEVEIHHVDLDLGYETTDWPEEFLRSELPLLLRAVPGRVSRPDDLRALVAWLSGRGPLPTALELDAW